MDGLRRIMIVEDEPNVRLVLLAALGSNGYTLLAAEDGETALRWLKRDTVDLVLLDLQMPGMGGMETLRKLREAGIKTPVVIVSAHDSVPNVVQAVRLGAVDFLPKPTTPGSLRKVVAEVLSRESSPSMTSSSEASSKIAPPVSPSHTALVRAKRALSRRDFGGAEMALTEAISRDTHCAEGHYLMGILHEMRDDRHAAYSDYRAALQADPKFEPARLHLMKYFDNKLM